LACTAGLCARPRALSHADRPLRRGRRGAAASGRRVAAGPAVRLARRAGRPGRLGGRSCAAGNRRGGPAGLPARLGGRLPAGRARGGARAAAAGARLPLPAHRSCTRWTPALAASCSSLPAQHAGRWSTTWPASAPASVCARTLHACIPGLGCRACRKGHVVNQSRRARARAPARARWRATLRPHASWPQRCARTRQRPGSPRPTCWRRPSHSRCCARRAAARRQRCGGVGTRCGA
jgi:hypothetical protein